MLIIVSKHTKHPSAHLHMNSPPLAFRDLGLKYLIVGSDCPARLQFLDSSRIPSVLWHQHLRPHCLLQRNGEICVICPANG